MPTAALEEREGWGYRGGKEKGKEDKGQKDKSRSRRIFSSASLLY